MKCPTCGQICRNDREFCALCGTSLKHRRVPGGWIALLVILILAGFAAAYLFGLKDPLHLLEKLRSAHPEEARPAAVETISAVPETASQEAEPMPMATSRPDALWNDAAEIYARDRYTLALCRDGTVKLAGQSASPEFGFDLFDWTRIRQLIYEDYFVAGLTEEGRVRLTGEVSGYEQAARWTDVDRLYFDGDSLLGLTKEGQVLAAGPSLRFDPAEFSDVSELIPCGCDTLALGKDGRIRLLRREDRLWDAKGLHGVAAAAANRDFAFYLMEDGSIYPGASFQSCVKDRGWPNPYSAWTNVVQILLSDRYLLGLTGDGKLLCAPCVPGDTAPDTSGWSGVKQMLLDRQRGIVYGVTAEGRVLAASPDGAQGLPPLSWENVEQLQINAHYWAALTRDGRVLTAAWSDAPATLRTEDWENVSAIALSGTHLAGLLADGDVLTTGDNSFGQCG